MRKQKQARIVSVLATGATGPTPRENRYSEKLPHLGVRGFRRMRIPAGQLWLNFRAAYWIGQLDNLQGRLTRNPAAGLHVVSSGLLVMACW